MDLSKLSPAPWETTGGGYIGIVAVIRGERSQIGRAEGCGRRLSDEEVEENGQFIALARNAFDVMMRRGWAPDGCPMRTGRWIVLDVMGDPVMSEEYKWPDPFTALVQADLWYKANVENQ